MLGHDLSYLLDVLNIADGETEDELDDRLRSEAKELGVHVEEQQQQQNHKAYAASEQKPLGHENAAYPRRSESIDSRASHSTGLTSNYSDLSKDHAHSSYAPRRRSRTSLNFRDYDAFVSRGVPLGRHSMSFSPLTTPSHSTFSLPLSQPSSPDSFSPKKHFRRIRGLSMLKLHSRNASDASLAESCPHCPQDASNQRRAVHKLPCGHRLCTQALRNTVKAATESQTGGVPSCCGKPIPGSMVEHVMTQEEQSALLEKLEQWDEAVSIAPSVTSSRRDSIPSIAQRRPGALSARSRTVSEESRLDALPAKERGDFEHVVSREDYKLLRTGQSEQRDRFLRWVDRQWMELKTEHERMRSEMKQKHESTGEDMAEHHASAMAEAEDKQVKAEADMRQTQEQERRDSATALKHMEAYCAGTYSTGDPHNRTITEQDRAELDKARRTRDQMDTKHESQINVLRGEQSRRMRLRAQRQERELQETKRQQRQEELQFERACTAETSRLDETVALKQRKIQWRWELQMAIFAKKVEAEMDVHLACRLPTADWNTRHDSTATSYFTARSDSKHGISTGFAVRARPRTNEFSIGG